MASNSPTSERERIEALYTLANAARSAFNTTATLTGICAGVDAFNVLLGDRDTIAKLVAELIAVQRPELRDALDRARYWLGNSSSVRIPFLISRPAPSASEGALTMLNRLAALVADDLRLVEGGSVDSARLPADVDNLAAMLNEHWQKHPLPVWLRFSRDHQSPTAALKQLADVAWRENNHPAHHDTNWVTVTQAAREQGVRTDVITKAANRGELITNGKTGRARRIDAASLIRWSLQRADNERARD